MNKLAKAAYIRTLLNDYFRQENRFHYSTLTNTFQIDCSRFSDSTLIKHYKAATLDKVITTLKNDFKLPSNYEQLVNEMVAFITRHEAKKGIESSFTLDMMLRGKLRTEYQISDFEQQSKINTTAYNMTHPKTPLRRNH